MKRVCSLTLGFLFLLAAPAYAEVTIKEAWVRATPGAAKVTAGYATVSNSGPGDDVLIRIETPDAGMSHLHSSQGKDGVMRMEAVPELQIPAGKNVALTPGGYHVMIMGLKMSLKAGDELPLTFVFKTQGPVKVTAKVMPLSYSGGGL